MENEAKENKETKGPKETMETKEPRETKTPAHPEKKNVPIWFLSTFSSTAAN